MKALEQLALGWQALLHTLRVAKRPALWTPWLVLLAAQLAAVVALWQFAHPALSWLTVPLFVLAGGDAVLHYPASLLELPWLYAHADLTLALLLGPLVTGWSLGAFGEAFGLRPVAAGGAAARAVRRYASLWLAQLPLLVVVVALVLGLEEWLGRERHGLLVSILERLAVEGGLIVAQTLLFFVPAGVALGGHRALDALHDVPLAARRAGWAAFALTLLSNVAILPFRVATERATGGAGGAAPERVLAFLALEIVVSVVFSFLLAGGAALLYLGAVSPSDEGHA